MKQNFEEASLNIRIRFTEYSLECEIRTIMIQKSVSTNLAQLWRHRPELR
jgi:hypothetical protein